MGTQQAEVDWEAVMSQLRTADAALKRVEALVGIVSESIEEDD